MQRYFTSFGFAEADDQRSADRIAYRRWLEEGWEQGGYKPMAREEFEAEHPEVSKNFRDFK